MKIELTETAQASEKFFFPTTRDIYFRTTSGILSKTGACLYF